MGKQDSKTSRQTLKDSKCDARLTLLEYKVERLLKVVDSDDTTDSALDRRLLKLETKVNFLSKTLYGSIGLLAAGLLGLLAELLRK